MADGRAERVRATMRRQWGERSQHYTERAAPQTTRYAELLISAVAPIPGERVLDVATGPGVVAVAAAEAVGPTGSVLATDLAPEWEPIVRERVAAAGLRNVDFATMGAESLDLADESFDVALCQFGLMFVPEPGQALREMRRVLREGGRLGVTVWSSADRVACFIVARIIREAAAVSEAEPMPTPLDLGEPGMIERLVGDAGFTSIITERRTLDHYVDDAEAEWARWADDPAVAAAVALRALDAGALERVRREAMERLESFREGDRINLKSEAIIVTAVR